MTTEINVFTPLNSTIQHTASPPFQVRCQADLEALVSRYQTENASPIALSLAGCEQLEPSVMQPYFRFLASQMQRLQFVRPDGHHTTDVFEALNASLSVDIQNSDLLRVTVELAGAWTTQEQNLDLAVQRARTILQNRRVRVPHNLRSLVQQASARYIQAEVPEQRIAEILVQLVGEQSGFEVDDDLHVPRGWMYDLQRNVTLRVSSTVQSSQEISIPGLFFAHERSVDPATSEQHVRLCWIQNAQVNHYQLSRQQLLITRQAEQLSGLGLPVSSVSSRDFVSYFADFFRDNDFRLKTCQTSNHLGWQQLGDTPVFALGETILSPTNCNEQLAPQIQLRNCDRSLGQLQQAFRRAGDSAGSLQLLREISRHPVAWFTAMASLSGVLLEPLGLRPYMVDICGDTSSGKTILLSICGSLWGSPELHEGRSVIQSWNTTRVHMERYAASMRSIPIFLDDSRQVMRNDVVSQICYDLTNGHGRGRGTITGIAEQAAWNLVAISTGEQSLVSFGEQAGCRARIITLRGSPFAERNVESRDYVDRLRSSAELNYGHIAPAFIQHVIDNHSQWSRWRDRLEQLKRDLAVVCNQNVIAGRHLEYLALNALTAELFCDLFDFPAELRCPVNNVRHLLAAEYQEADRPLEAMERLLDYVGMNPHFVIRTRPGSHQDCQNPSAYGPSQIIGKRLKVRSDSVDAESLAITNEAFMRLMNEFGFNSDETITAWKQRGWLHVDGDRKVKSVHFGNHKVRCVCIRGDVLKRIEDSRSALAAEAEVHPINRGTLPSVTGCPSSVATV